MRILLSLTFCSILFADFNQIYNGFGLDIGSSIKISSIKLPENVTPTIQGRDFVIATVAAPTVVKEPEKPAAEGAEGEAAEEGTETAAAGAEKPAEETDKSEGDKSKKVEDKASSEKK